VLLTHTYTVSFPFGTSQRFLTAKIPEGSNARYISDSFYATSLIYFSQTAYIRGGGERDVGRDREYYSLCTLLYRY